MIILTTFEIDEYILGALRAGASGFLLKRSSPEQLIAAIHTVADGEALLSPSVTRRLIERVAAHPTLSRNPDPRLADLTTRGARNASRSSSPPTSGGSSPQATHRTP